MEARFWSKVEVDGDCLVWKAGIRGKSGYGSMRVGKKIIDAHRIAYFLFYGDIPKGLFVCHECDNRKCVNPAHLWVGTCQDNMDDAKYKNRLPSRKKPLVHGTGHGYRLGCKCSACKAAHASENRGYYSYERRHKKWVEHSY
jgi:hypothetical protein